MPRVEIDNVTHKNVKIYAVAEEITVQEAYSRLLEFSLNHIKTLRKIDDFRENR